jgi:hypothetical protein
MHLRDTLAKIVVAGLPACTGGDCYEHKDATFQIQISADPPTQLLIESCRADADACMNLCESVLENKTSGGSLTGCNVGFRSDAAVVKIAYETYAGGRNCPVPVGRRTQHVRDPDKLVARDLAGAWLAEAAWLEGASVHAFHQLASELAVHGAPALLIRAAQTAARDEARHAIVVGALATRFGAHSPAVEVVAPTPRSLEALAIENAVEGCVRETWGAELAAWQARNAHDAEVRATFASIAPDEARHAALAWAVDRWSAARLDDAARARVADARASAASELTGTVQHAPHLALLGLPSGTHARALLARMWE